MDEDTEQRTTDRLSEADTGRWLVTTVGSRHVWDLDKRTVMRLPGAGRGRFPQDEHPVELWEVSVWPSVGGMFMIWYENPYRRGEERWHRSSLISRIEAIDDEGTVPAPE